MELNINRARTTDWSQISFAFYTIDTEKKWLSVMYFKEYKAEDTISEGKLINYPPCRETAMSER